MLYVRYWGLQLSPRAPDYVDENGNLRATAALWATRAKQYPDYQMRAYAINGRRMSIDDERLLTRYFRMAAGREMLRHNPQLDMVGQNELREMAVGYVCRLWFKGQPNPVALYKDRRGWQTVPQLSVGPQVPTPNPDPWLELEGVRVTLLDGSLSLLELSELKAELEDEAQRSLNALHILEPWAKE